VIEMWPQRRLSKEDTLAFEAMAARISEALRERMRRTFRRIRSVRHPLPSMRDETSPGT
jgi:hypothetical protein